MKRVQIKNGSGYRFSRGVRSKSTGALPHAMRCSVQRMRNKLKRGC